MTTLAPRATLPPVAARPAAAAQAEAVRVGAGLTLAAALVLVTSWWLRDGGLGAVVDLGSALTALGQLSGLAGSVLLLAQVLLMARLPVLERAFGQDRLAGLHRLVGFTSFSLVMVHVVTVTWGYAAGSLTATPGMLWTLTWDYPGMLLAAGGTACLVMVVVTSIRAARRRLRYESWHLLHLYAYLGVGLALPHQLWTGQQLTTSPARTVFWWTAWALAAAAVVGWRVLLPLARNLRHRLRVTSVVAEAPGVWSVYLTGRRLDLLRAEPGQFLLWRFLGGPGRSRAHPYSLSAAPDGRSLRITVAAAGDDSSRVAALRPGSRVLVEGPYGRLTPRAREARKVAFIGAGVGMAPLRALAEGMAFAPGEAVYVERYRATPLFAAEVDVLARERGLQVLRLPGARRTPDSWLPVLTRPVDDATALRGWVPDIAERDVYVCGPPGWSALVRSSLAAAGVPEQRLHIEEFGW
ncbi:ferredoxin reductase family protein [Nocardioides daeguensis]|uniref:Ferric reductase-like transmembrane domain-containing protein n=1 Tax=Nocardioides daeguensis TaxID=908359 RepID=A0ABP6VF65_9ACTN|nr:ferredoxin reductase family protein [Nocardioides daeguensis]MBV6729410.1 ferric reductase-like transmembrane domain-containing protein [Nocardioides daeguensis]MCR1771817.1 ferric reductase-like transmembrane domain-containing protein [Nocardioides daeguensis]